MNTSLAAMVESYLAGPATLRSGVAGMSREHLVARPVPGRWSTLEVVCHLADFEPVLVDRMKKIIALNRPVLYGLDEAQLPEKLAYQERDLEEELTLIEATRKQMARILRTLPTDVVYRDGVHSERGLVTLENVLASAINHIPHHLKFIEEKRKALGLPLE